MPRSSPSAATAPRLAPAPARDRAATELRILAALEQTLSVQGFGGVGINAIAKAAGVDKVLIYRYFGGLPQLLEAYGRSGRFWPSVEELLGEDRSAVLALPMAERYAVFFSRFIDALRARPLTLEILAQEMIERNELTAILEEEREQWGHDVASAFGDDPAVRAPWLAGTTLLLIAGVQLLLVRARKIRIFGGVDLRTDEGWAMLKSSIREAALRMYRDPPGS